MSGASGGNAAERRPRRSPERGGHLRPVAERADGLLLGEEVLDDARHLGIDPDELGRATSGDDDGREVRRIDVGERDVDRARPARLLDVRVEVGLEVVDDELDRSRRRRSDVRLVTRLGEPVLDEHRLEVLGGVAGEDQHLRHGGIVVGEPRGRWHDRAYPAGLVAALTTRR